MDLLYQRILKKKRQQDLILTAWCQISLVSWMNPWEIIMFKGNEPSDPWEF